MTGDRLWKSYTEGCQKSNGGDSYARTPQIPLMDGNMEAFDFGNTEGGRGMMLTHKNKNGRKQMCMVEQT